MTEPVGWLRAVVFEADELGSLSAFWRELLGTGQGYEEAGWSELVPGSKPTFLAFETTGADEPEGLPASPIRLRPDIEVEDLDVARARVEALGGRLVAELHHGEDEVHLRMADPEGNEFTLVLPPPPDKVAGPTDG